MKEFVGRNHEYLFQVLKCERMNELKFSSKCEMFLDHRISLNHFVNFAFLKKDEKYFLVENHYSYSYLGLCSNI